MEAIKKEGRKLLKVRVLHDGGKGWTFNFNGGYKVFKGDSAGLAKFLKKIQAKDFESEPKSARNITYPQMADELLAQGNGYIWVWDNILRKVKSSQIKQAEATVLVLDKNYLIQDCLFEKEDKIVIVSEDTDTDEEGVVLYAADDAQAVAAHHHRATAPALVPSLELGLDGRRQIDRRHSVPGIETDLQSQQA